MGRQQTTKKTKYRGVEKFINTSTGEVEEFAITEIEERDFNFHKIWLRNFISTLDIVGNQKTRLCFWIIDNLNKENQLIYSYRQIADKSGISLDTVRITMKILLDADFLRKNGTAYIVNPDIVFKGTRNGRVNVLNSYVSAEYKPMSNAEKAEALEREIRTLQQRLNELTKGQITNFPETQETLQAKEG